MIPGMSLLWTLIWDVHPLGTCISSQLQALLFLIPMDKVPLSVPALSCPGSLHVFCSSDAPALSALSAQCVSGAEEPRLGRGGAAAQL